MPKHENGSLYGPIDLRKQLEAWKSLVAEKTTEHRFQKIDFDATSRLVDSIVHEHYENGVAKPEFEATADGWILMPKYNEIIEPIGYTDEWTRRAANRILSYSEAHKYCRGVRWLKRLIEAEKHMEGKKVLYYFFGSPFTSKKDPKKVARYIAEHLHDRLNRRAKTERAIQILAEKQPGPFLAVPYRISEDLQQVWPRTSLGRLAMDEFAIPIDLIQSWILMRLRVEPNEGQKGFDVITTTDEFEVHCLGDKLIHMNDAGGEEDNMTSVRWASGCLKFDAQPTDEPAKLRLVTGDISPVITKM